ELPKFFKRYQIQPVWRADRPAKGRFREFYQCDIDTIGSTSPIVEAEQLASVAEILTRLGFQDFIVRLNHRAALTALLQVAGVVDASSGDALVALDKLDKIGPDGVTKELVGRGVAPETAARLLSLFSAVGAGDPTAQLATLRGLLETNEAGRRAADNLAAILN